MTDRSIEDASRKQFEAWALKEELDIEKFQGFYVNDYTDAKWLGWKASRQSISQSEPLAGYVSKLPITNPQSIRADANDVFKVPVYAAPQQAIPSGWIDSKQLIAEINSEVTSSGSMTYKKILEIVEQLSAAPTAPIDNNTKEK
jgi:hypothetical protein